MCAIARCYGVWVAVHGINHTILAVGGRGAAGKRRAPDEARTRQRKYGPAGRIGTIHQDEVNCWPMLEHGPAARRIRRELRELR